MDKPVSVVLVGIGGYGNTYVDALLRQPSPAAARIAAVVDPRPEGCRRLGELEQAGIPCYRTLEDCLARQTAELAVLSSPIHFHVPQTVAALEQGCRVLCEKPLGARIQDARAMVEARDRRGGFVAIGYQWSFSAAIQALKADILAGRLGAPRRLRTLVLWPRGETYYRRNQWAGAQRAPDGTWILDSPANNAAAHYLHNMLYLTGPAADRSDMPRRLRAELYRANPIGNFDTCAVRARTESGAEVLFYASHAVRNSRGPEFLFEFDRASVRFEGKSVTARFADGSVHDYGNPNADGARKLWDCVRAAREETPIACGPETASAQTLCINGMYESLPTPAAFPPEWVQCHGDTGSRMLCVEGLEDVLAGAYARGALPAEEKVPWATTGDEIDLDGYAEFPRPPRNPVSEA
ncbi:MAG: Gfo/Idh/MocA family oxidoreductase [Lentisphaeria bacterium]|nr:Gfo/Idh/MocA family oxidoreductase [Lentisphaeria bacterium]